MPNKYKRIPGSRPYKNYSDDTLKRCLLAVRTKSMTQREAEKAFKIPRRTIINKLKGHHVQSIGRPTVFAEAEEDNFVGNIHVMSEYGFPIDKTDLKYIIKSYLDRNGRRVPFFPHNLPGRTWTDNFLKRHQSLSVRLASNIKRSRASINEEILIEYINNLKKTLIGVDPQNIFNYDETNLTDNPGQKKVLVKRGSKYPERICNTSKVSISLMICGNAVGDILPPYVVYKAKGLWENWTEHGPKGCRYNATTSGWFDAHIFTDWFNNTLLRYFKNKPGKKVVIGDNLSSHLTPEVVDKCKKENIYFVCLPPNSTHLTQPLDVALFHPMKVAWRKILGEWKGTTNGLRNTILQKQSFPGLLKKLLDVLEPTLKTTLKHGFRKCGIYPCGVEELLNRLPMASNYNSSVDEAFIEHLKVKRSETTQPTIKRKKIKIPAGTSYAHIDDELPNVDSSECEEDIQNSTNTESSSVNEVNDCPVSSDGKYAINDFVLVNYLKTMYPGIITSIVSYGAIVNSMEKSKTFYKWPVKEDKMFYKWNDILMKIKPPQPVRRGYFKIEELDEYTT